MKERLTKSLVVLLLLLVGASAYAQQTIRETVKDAQGEPMVG